MTPSRSFPYTLFLGLAFALLALLAAPLPASAAGGRGLHGLPFFNVTGRRLQGLPFFNVSGRRLSSETLMNVNGRRVMGVPLHLI